MKGNMLNRIPLKIYRDLRWLKNEKQSYSDIRSKFSKEYADIWFSAEKAIHKYGKSEETYRAINARDKYIMNYIEDSCRDVIEKYKNAEAQTDSSNQSDKKIWVFWWTGEESAPDIVKACVKSIRKNAGNHEVVFIDKDNYEKYVNLPAPIIEKHDLKQLSHAHFSDILRHTLLAKYGGVWIDSTVFVSKPLPEFLFESPFYTAKSVDLSAFYFSRSRWTGYFLCGETECPLFSFTRDMLIDYWEKNDFIIDYLLMDYVFDIACKTIPSVKAVMEKVPDNNLLRGKLMAQINEPYSKELFSELQNGDTFISKLSWRYGNPVEKTNDGRLTNYGYLLKL